jgi:hypothetical protein
MSQILGYTLRLQSKLKSFVDLPRDLDSVAFDELWEILLSTLDEIPRDYYIVDALDEMNIGNGKFMQ